MPEALSITTGVLALLRVTWTAGYELKKFCDQVSVVSDSITALLQDVEGLEHVLGSMQETFEAVTARNGSGRFTSHWANIARFLMGATGTIGDLASQVKDINKPTSFLEGPRKQLRLNFAEDKIVRYRLQIQSYREGLQLSMQTIILDSQLTQNHDTQILEPNLNDIGSEVRRIANDVCQLREMLLANSQTDHDMAEVSTIDDLTECVKSAASIVSSISSTASSQSDVQSDTDFADCFPVRHKETFRRWIEAGHHSEYESPSVAEVDVSDDSDESVDSDRGLDDEMTDVLLEDGYEKFEVGDIKNAERIFKKCLPRLKTSDSHRRSSHGAKRVAKHIDALACLHSIYESQQRWTEAKDILQQKLDLRNGREENGDSTFLSDLVALSKLHLREEDYVRALSCARRALRGFKKLQSADDINLCLGLLIDISNVSEQWDESEAYTIMLAKITSARAQSTEAQMGSHSMQSKPGGTGESSKDLHRGTLAHLEESHELLSESHQASILRHVHETTHDFIPFETPLGRPQRRREAALFEDLAGEIAALPDHLFREASNVEGSTDGDTDVASQAEDRTAVNEAPPSRTGESSKCNDLDKKSPLQSSTALHGRSLAHRRGSRAGSLTLGSAMATLDGILGEGQSELAPTVGYNREPLEPETSGSSIDLLQSDVVPPLSAPDTRLSFAASDRSEDSSTQATSRAISIASTYGTTMTSPTSREGSVDISVRGYPGAAEDEQEIRDCIAPPPLLFQPVSLQSLVDPGYLETIDAGSRPQSRHSWTQKQVDYEMQLTDREFVKTASHEPETQLLETKASSVTRETSDSTENSEPEKESLVRDSRDVSDQATTGVSNRISESAVTRAKIILAEKDEAVQKPESQSPQHDRETSIAVIGDGLCGKSALMQLVYTEIRWPAISVMELTDETSKFVAGDICNERLDVGWHERTVTAEVEGELVKVTIHVAQGQEDHVRRLVLLTGAKCVIACFAVNSPLSLENLQDHWLPPFRRQKIPVILVACKVDYWNSPESLERDCLGQTIIRKEDCHNARAKLGALKYLECSAKTGEGVEAVFEEAIRATRQRRRRRLFSSFGHKSEGSGTT